MLKQKFSIIMPAYNAQSFIAASIKSALAQSHENLELIIIDDCSSDETLGIINKYKAEDSRVKLIRNAKNIGVAESRNRGLAESNGDFISFLDSDDIWYPDKLEKQHEVFLDRRPPVVYSSYHLIDESGDIVGYRKVKCACSYPELLRRNYIGNLTASYDRSQVKNIKFKQIGHEDYAFWLEILRTTKGVAIGLVDCLAQYRVRSGSLSSNKLYTTLWTWNIYKNIENLSHAESFFFTLSQSIGALGSRVKNIGTLNNLRQSES